MPPGGQTFLTHRRKGGHTFFSHRGWGTNIFTLREGIQTFYVGGGGSYDDVDEEMDVSKARKLSAGARILGP